MSSSRAKQICQGRKRKTKPNGTKYSHAKKKRMRKGPKNVIGLTKKRK